MDLNLYSTKYHDKGNNIEELNSKTIRFEMESAKRITIVSAYYSVSFLKSLLRRGRKKDLGKFPDKFNECKLELIFNGFSGERLQNQIIELLDLKTTLEKWGFQSVSILLNKTTTLFHTKLYFITNEKGSLWFCGSANASSAAFSTNEEFITRNTTNISAVEKYISNLIMNSKPVENIVIADTKESNIIGFFRTGSIYFKPNIQISFTFDGLNIPKSVERKLAQLVPPENANPGKAWGAYNLLLSLGINDYEESEKKCKVKLKPWSIETCFGYWVPNKYRPKVDDQIEQKTKALKTRLENILHRMKIRGIKSLEEDYKSYLADVKRILKENKIKLPIDERALQTNFKNFIKRIIAKLDNAVKLKKLCQPIISTGMPEIWEDNSAFNDFKETFFDYTSDCLSGPIPQIVKCMMKRIKFRDNDDSPKIENLFDKYFDEEEEEWIDDYWIDTK